VSARPAARRCRQAAEPRRAPRARGILLLDCRNIDRIDKEQCLPAGGGPPQACQPMEPNSAAGRSLADALASGQALNGSAGGVCRLAGGACDAGLSCSAMTVRRPPRRRGLAGWRSAYTLCQCMHACRLALGLGFGLTHAFRLALAPCLAAPVHDSACLLGQVGMRRHALSRRQGARVPQSVECARTGAPLGLAPARSDRPCDTRRRYWYRDRVSVT